LTATFKVVATGAPKFNYMFESGNTCVNPAHARLWFARTGWLKGGEFSVGGQILMPTNLHRAAQLLRFHWASVIGKLGNHDSASLDGFRSHRRCRAGWHRVWWRMFFRTRSWRIRWVGKMYYDKLQHPINTRLQQDAGNILAGLDIEHDELALTPICSAASRRDTPISTASITHSKWSRRISANRSGQSPRKVAAGKNVAAAAIPKRSANASTTKSLRRAWRPGTKSWTVSIAPAKITRPIATTPYLRA
jgi:hypothetical protein